VRNGSYSTRRKYKRNQCQWFIKEIPPRKYKREEMGKKKEK